MNKKEIINELSKISTPTGINYFCKNWDKEIETYEYAKGRLQS